MKAMIGILTLGLALVVCSREPRPAADDGQLLAAGLPSATTSASEAEQDSSPMVVRRLWFVADNLGFWGGPSPDGRYLSFSDNMTGDLAIHEFSTGESRRLTEVSNGEYAWGSAFSPDGERIAYGWRLSALVRLNGPRMASGSLCGLTDTTNLPVSSGWSLWPMARCGC
jgi:hypothetical protein